MILNYLFELFKWCACKLAVVVQLSALLLSCGFHLTVELGLVLVLVLVLLRPLVG